MLVYSLTFGLGLMISVVNPYISVTYLTSFAALPIVGIFGLILLSEILRNLTSAREKVLFAILFLAGIVGSFIVIAVRGYMPNIAGKFWSVLDPFLRESSPLIASVAEHRMSAWGSIYYELGVGILFFGIGLFFVSRKLNNKNLFFLLFGLTSLYFASSMVRLLVLLAPAFGVLAGIGIIGILKPFITLLREPPRLTVKRKFGFEHVGNEFSGIAVFLIFIVLTTTFAFAPQTGGTPNVYRQAYSPVTITAGSLPLAPNEPVREWLDMLKYLNDFQNKDIVVSSWWDYGYWLTILGNVTSLADNATINQTQIENIGFTFMANETYSPKMLRVYNAKYVLVFTTIYTDGSWAGYGDEGKWTWMARISGNTNWDNLVQKGFIDEQSEWTNETKFGNFNSTTNKWVWNNAGTNTTIYKLMSYAKHEWITLHPESGAQDSDYVGDPLYFKEAYFAGVDLGPQDSINRYGAVGSTSSGTAVGIIPLVCLYEIDWAKYDSMNP